MSLPKVVKLAETQVNLRQQGASSFFSPDFSRARKTAQGTLLWDPGIDGLMGGVSMQGESGDHAGERHLDGDELLYLISGAMRLALMDDADNIEEIPLHPGDAILVPQGRWHRLIVDQPSQYLYFGGGRTEIRPAPRR